MADDARLARLVKLLLREVDFNRKHFPRHPYWPFNTLVPERALVRMFSYPERVWVLDGVPVPRADYTTEEVRAAAAAVVTALALEDA